MKPFNLSTFQPFNLSTFQPFNLSTFQVIFLIFLTLGTLSSCMQDTTTVVDTQISNNDLVDTRSDNCPDYTDSEGCEEQTSTFVQGGTLIYDGCPLPYTVTGYLCAWGIYFDPPVIDYSEVNAALFNPDSECYSLMSTMFSLFLQGRYSELNDLHLDIRKSASLFAQNRILEFRSNFDADFFPCDGDNPPLSYTIVTQETRCSMLCAEVKTGTGIFFSEILCGEGCCSRSTPFCIAGPGDIEYGLPTFTDVVECVNDDDSIFSVYTDDCPDGFTSLEVCNSACDKL